MTPAQLQIVAELYAQTNGGGASSSAPADVHDPTEGTVADLMAFASMTRR